MKIFYISVLSILFLASCSGGPPQEEMVVPVVVSVAKEEKVVDAISEVGTLVANEAVQIKSEIEGKIESIEFNEGQGIAANTVLFKIDHKKLAAEVAEAKANFNLAKADLARSKLLLSKRTISSQEYDQALSTFSVKKAALELAEERLDDASVKAPFDGIMGARLISPGQYVSAGTVLSSIVNVNPIKVEFNLPERVINKLKVGQKVNIEVVARREQAFVGEVYFVAPQVDVQTRTILIKALIDNEQGLLKPGMFASLKLEVTENKQAITIPESAVLMQGEQVHVMVVDQDDRAQIQEVKLGTYLDGAVEVIEGLAAGDKVVSEGLQKVAPGFKLAYQQQS